MPDLLFRFSSAEGYALFPDVLPFLRRIKAARERSRHTPNAPKVILGIITNSDDRVIPILSSLQASLTPRRYRPGTTAYFPALQRRDDNDIQFLTLSYDVGFEKPDRRIFDAAKRIVNFGEDLQCKHIHIGDDLDKDARGAEAAGWEGVILDRDNKHENEALPRVKSLTELGDILLSRRTGENFWTIDLERSSVNTLY